MKLVLPLVSVAIFMGITEGVEAYRVIDQNALQLNERTVLYTITFGLGFKKYETSVPVLAVRDDGDEMNRGAIAYELFKENGEIIDSGEVHAIVLSNAEIDSGMYRVPHGESARFTLAALVTLPETEVHSEYDLALSVSYLPFDMTVIDGVTIQGKLNDSELQYYRAPLGSE